MIIARIESLILGMGMDEAMERARKYVDAGADGVMIHSKKSDASEVFQFANLFRSEFPRVPLVAVPSTYNSVREDELEQAGFNIVIYANQMLRASFPAMTAVGESILSAGRSLESDNKLMSISEILDLIPGTR